MTEKDNLNKSASSEPHHFINWMMAAVEIAECVSNVQREARLIPPQPADLLDFDRRRIGENGEIIYTLDQAADFDPETPLRTVTALIQREIDHRVRTKENLLPGCRLVVKVIKGDKPDTLGMTINVRRAGK